MRKGYALALLAVFALVLGGAGCCQKYYDQCKCTESKLKLLQIGQLRRQ